MFKRRACLATCVDQNHRLIVSDGMKALGTKVTAVDTKVTALDVKVGVLDTKVDAQGQTITKLEGKVDAQGISLAALDTKVTFLDTKVDAQGQNMRRDWQETNKVLASLVRDVGRLEGTD